MTKQIPNDVTAISCEWKDDPCDDSEREMLICLSLGHSTLIRTFGKPSEYGVVATNAMITVHSRLGAILTGSVDEDSSDKPQEEMFA